MDVQSKLAILADAAKYDASCASSGTDLNENTKVLVTVHPSYLLRLPDEEANAREYELLVRDLKTAAALLDKMKSAA